jgi:hypothetical protein
MVFQQGLPDVQKVSLLGTHFLPCALKNLSYSTLAYSWKSKLHNTSVLNVSLVSGNLVFFQERTRAERETGNGGTCRRQLLTVE